MSHPEVRFAGVGVFGGTFNPIHLGHLRAAEEVAESLALEQVLFVPSAQPPHKPPDPAEVIAPARERLAWVQLAIADNPRFAVDPIEVERGGPSYSVETLGVLARRLAPQRPIFIIGCDAFAEIASWRDPESLLRLAHFAVITRPPVREGKLADWLPPRLASEIELDADARSGRHRSTRTWIRVVEIPSLQISSSDVRQRLREARSVRYLLPEVVRQAILASGIYRSGRLEGERRAVRTRRPNESSKT